MLNDLIQSLGYVGVFLLMLFFATELVMPLAGFLAAGSELWLPGVILSGIAGSVTGSFIIYYVARFVDPKIIHAIAAKYGRFVGISSASTKRAEAWFDRHARASVLLGKFAPGVRSATSLVAGYRHMRLCWFLACTAIATAANVTLLGVAGFIVSDNYETLERIVSDLSMSVRVLIIGSIVAFVIYRRRQQKRQHSA